jgi:hypothetical protein
MRVADFVLGLAIGIAGGRPGHRRRLMWRTARRSSPPAWITSITSAASAHAPAAALVFAEHRRNGDFYRRHSRDADLGVPLRDADSGTLARVVFDAA